LSGRTAQASETSFFLSVHHDSVQPHLLQRWEFDGQTRLFSDQHAGFSLFVSRANPDVAGSLRCASAIGRALRVAGFTPSLYHAAPIAGEFKPFADRENGVHYYDNLVVLKTARQPALLLEAGVIVNRDEELLLLTPAYQARMSEAVADGLRACLL
jgi:N-acetylmuramoyl-L-alanine amidase